MKRTDIAVGLIYSDGKLGVRRVLRVDQEKVEYTTLAAAQSTNIREATMLLGSFASWAAEMIEPEALETHMLSLQACKLVPKLTATQVEFFESIDEVLNTTTEIECQRHEWRTARDCLKKGLIGLIPEKLKPNESTFEVTLTALGVQILRLVLANKRANAS